MSFVPVLSVHDLRVSFTTSTGSVAAVRGISFDVYAGQTLAIVGETGSGKSQASMAIMGLTAANGQVEGTALYRGLNLTALSETKLNKIRGKKITMIFQEPMTSLDPLYTIGRQLAEPLIYHSKLRGHAIRTYLIQLLQLVGIDRPEQRLASYPHELSGGQRQRIMIAMALANQPDILIADEPTTALDVTIQAQVLQLLADLQRRFGMAIIFITHDLNIVSRFADQVCVMQAGQIVESAPVQSIFLAPQHPYTKLLLNAEPQGSKPPPLPTAPVILDAKHIKVDFKLRSGWLRPPTILRAVNDISLNLQEGQTIGIVGESGSGKSTLGRALLKLIKSDGQISYCGRVLPSSPRSLRSLRRDLQIVFQDPYGSLSPRMPVGRIITEGLLIHEPNLTKSQRIEQAEAALSEVGLAWEFRNRYPHQLSGGQRQRVAIARSLILKPKVIVLDEPTSALDRSVQKQIIDLLKSLQLQHGFSYLFISHDLAVIRAMADYLIVMKHGKIVEQGATAQVFLHRQAEYTKQLIKAASGDFHAH